MFFVKDKLLRTYFLCQIEKKEKKTLVKIFKKIK